MPSLFENMFGSVNAAVKATEEINKRVDDAIARLDADVSDYLQVNNPEKRIVYNITVGGSANWLYPVLFQAVPLDGGAFGAGASGITRMQLFRHFSWNSGTDERPFNDASTAQGGLLLDMEVFDRLHGGNGGQLRLKTYRQTYTPTASHLRWAGHSMIHTTDGQVPDYDYRIPGTDDADPATWVARLPRWSSVYLRGGGATYRVISNNPLNFLRLDDESLDPATNYKEVFDADLISQWVGSPTNTRFRISPIPLAQLEEPVEGMTWR